MATDDTTACSPRCTAPPDASVTIQHESLPCARTPRAGTRASDTCREAATERGNCRANVRGTRTSIDARKCTCRRRARRGINTVGNEMKCRIHNPWAGGRMTVDVFWIAGGRRHCFVFVLGPFCSISHGSTLRRKGWTNPTIHSQVFVFVLARGGCGRGASALPLNASEAC
jgi:hypothetical protein